MDDLSMLGADEGVFDLSDAGIQEKEVVVTVSGAEVQTTDNGTRAVVTFTSDDIPFAITKREWLKHTNPKAQEIGRANLRKLSIAITGAPQFSVNAMSGQRVGATLFENKDGFADLKRFKALAS